MRAPSLGVSAAIHALVLGVALVLPAGVGRKAPKPRPVEVVFYRPPAPPPPAPPPPAPKARPKPAVPKPADAPKPRPAPPPPVVVAATRPAPRDPVPPASRPPAPSPPALEVRTGSFAAKAPAPSPVERPRAARAVTAAGFGESTFAGSRTVETAKPAVVVSAGFGGAPAAPRPAVALSAPVATGGFGSVVAEAAAPARSGERPIAALETAVEILSKPKPAYTDEARSLRVEGDVVLEVTFEADGRLRVHRVLDSLGHGLDEAAVDAAEKIRFKPARRDGRPVDHTATLRVVFRLA